MATFDEWTDKYLHARDSTAQPSTEWAEYADREQILQFFDFLIQHPPATVAQQRWVQVVMAKFIRRAAESQIHAEHQLIEKLVDSYRQLADYSGRYQFLQLLAQLGGEQAAGQLANVLAHSPPTETTQVAQLLSPLLQSQRRHELRLLFPRILDAVEHISTAAAVLDIANFATRSGLLPIHPAGDRGDRLAAMLGDLALRLQKLDESYSADPDVRARQKRQIDDSVPLVVSLCDTLALLGDERHVGMLNRALALRHRRIQTEAAAALARLGDQTGQQRLIELAAEPTARLRVLAYADELGILEKIDPKSRTDAAQAEASLALWLAEPSQLGFPPSTMQLVDQRELYWPGYDEAVDCYLFRFEYELGPGNYSNVGIAGPLTHAFAASLEDLPPDDIYAAFAGWHAEHADISEQSAQTAAAQATVRHFVAQAEADGYSQLEPLTIASFFGDQVLVARATKKDRRGVVVVDHQSIDWWPGDVARRPISEFEAYCIYKGRRLLAAFN